MFVFIFETAAEESFVLEAGSTKDCIVFYFSDKQIDQPVGHFIFKMINNIELRLYIFFGMWKSIG